MQLSKNYVFHLNRTRMQQTEEIIHSNPENNRSNDEDKFHYETKEKKKGRKSRFIKKMNSGTNNLSN